MSKHTTPAKTMGGNTRKQLSKGRGTGTGTHSAKVPKAVRMKNHDTGRKGTRKLGWMMAGSD